jgi:hypothetical protein
VIAPAAGAGESVKAGACSVTSILSIKAAPRVQD